MKKVVYLLNLGGSYAPQITSLTYPLIRNYARKIGAGVVEIRDRKFPDWPITYEKLQIHELAKANGAEWNIYIDSDALVHPDTPDWTNFIPKDTVAHNGIDMANLRWKYDHVFLRDGRNIGSCNWFTIASHWCLDLWRPLDDITPREALESINPTVEEMNTVITPDHLVDDYALSRNIARFGLKVQTLLALEKQLGFVGSEFLHHLYTIPTVAKAKDLEETLERWKVDPSKYAS